MSEINKRYDFLMLFDVTDGNPNGDPDAGNLPRMDAETGQGLVTDVCLKRKVRNYIQLTRGDQPGFDIYVKEKAVLTAVQGRAYQALGLDSPAADSESPDKEAVDKEAAPAKGGKGAKGAKAKTAKKASDSDNVEKARDWMCKNFFDIRAFGAVMSLAENPAGQVRGPVQLTFARSIDPVVTMEHSITRMAVATQKEADKQGGDNRTMGRKYTVPYGLYRGFGFVAPALARKTGFSTEDLDIFWGSLIHMFEHDHSAARGLMAMRKLLIFEHENEHGMAPAHRLFESVNVRLRESARPARAFADYQIDIGVLPQGVRLIER